MDSIKTTRNRVEIVEQKVDTIMIALEKNTQATESIQKTLNELMGAKKAAIYMLGFLVSVGTLFASFWEHRR